VAHDQRRDAALTRQGVQKRADSLRPVFLFPSRPTLYCGRTGTIGASPSGKAADFGSAIPRFESWRPSHRHHGEIRSVDYPGDWHDLGNAGAPDTEQYFSSETAGAPLGMTAQGVFETIEVQSISTRPCPPPYVSQGVIRRSPISVDGVETTLYVINMTPTGAEPAYIAGVWVTHGGACYSVQFLSLTPETRDANTSVAAQAIASFKFGS
jgi:hypothetical protein